MRIGFFPPLSFSTEKYNWLSLSKSASSKHEEKAGCGIANNGRCDCSFHVKKKPKTYFVCGHGRQQCFSIVEGCTTQFKMLQKKKMLDIIFYHLVRCFAIIAHNLAHLIVALIRLEQIPCSLFLKCLLWRNYLPFLSALSLLLGLLFSLF